MSLKTAFIAANLNITHTTTLDLAVPREILQFVNTYSFSEGTGDFQAQSIFHDKRTLGAGEFEDINLTSGLEDSFGNALNFDTINLFYFHNLHASGADEFQLDFLTPTNGWSSMVFGTLDVPGGYVANGNPGGIFLNVAPDSFGFTVTVNDTTFRVTNNGSGYGDYELLLIGKDA